MSQLVTQTITYGLNSDQYSISTLSSVGGVLEIMAGNPHDELNAPTPIVDFKSDRSVTFYGIADLSAGVTLPQKIIGTNHLADAAVTSAKIAPNVNIVGTLTGTASKATADGEGNTITTTYLPLTGGTLSGNLEIGGNATVSGKNIVRSINGTVAGTDGNVTLNVSVDPLIAYPVGSIYMSVNSTSPSTLFGGTWVALNEGRVLIGAGTAYPAGSTGGEATHTLTIDEMPSHSHSGSSSSAGDHTHTRGTQEITGWFSLGNNMQAAYIDGRVFQRKEALGGKAADPANDSSKIQMYASQGWYGNTSSSGSHSHSMSLDNTGGGSAHNNMQPYLSVYMWKRTA